MLLKTKNQHLQLLVTLIQFMENVFRILKIIKWNKNLNYKEKETKNINTLYLVTPLKVI